MIQQIAASINQSALSPIRAMITKRRDMVENGDYEQQIKYAEI